MVDDAYDAIAKLGTAPLWRYFGDLFAAEPRSRAVPVLWSYAALRPHLLHFAEVLSLEEAERRVLMLVNPGLPDPPATTNNLYAGIQVILPGETAQAHRHSSGAFRFIIEGDGAYTTVNGERVHMHPGDLLLTPGWHWHDHAHEGDGPMLWLDGLDFPLVNTMEAGFFELYGERTQKAEVPDDISSRQFVHGRLTPAWDPHPSPNSPIGNYPWAETARAFDAIADDAVGSDSDGVLLEYTNPWTGGPVMPTIGCRVARLRPGFRGVPRRQTPSTIYHVVRGTGSTTVDGQRLEWGPKDVFAVPGWATYEHVNEAHGDAILFSYTDAPVLTALGLYREEVR
ncbi:cupin domain-containing protein [Plantactinospora sp. GCM10030261]|uniref:cupin domain-containing protein n=1 Tax=Plantactinospora sp. GCM10030261 TaxID=3273420 RepID=UPI003611B032